MPVLSEQRFAKRNDQGEQTAVVRLMRASGESGMLLPSITQNRTTSSPCCRAWKTLEGWRTKLAATPMMTYMSPPPPTLSGRVSSGKCFGDFGLAPLPDYELLTRPPN